MTDQMRAVPKQRREQVGVTLEVFAAASRGVSVAGSVR
jgi:hypothetical protein